MIHLHGRFDDQPDAAKGAHVIERADGSPCVEQWRLPQEKVRLWLLERTESRPLDSNEIGLREINEWMVEGTVVG